MMFLHTPVSAGIPAKIIKHRADYKCSMAKNINTFKNKMKILYDYQAFNQHHGGVSRYHVELIKNLQKLNVKCEVPFILSDNVYLEEIGIHHAKPLCQWNNNLRKNAYKWISQKCCLYHIETDRYDIFHPTFLNPYYIGKTKGKPVVATMHDLNHEKFTMADSKNVMAKRKAVLADATHIVAISQQTKNDLINYYDIDDKKVTVVYHGIDQDIYKTSGKRLFEKPYLLYVGGRNRYKNFQTFLYGFALLKEDIDLVCTGVTFNMEETYLIENLKIGHRIHQMFVSNDQMNQLMAQAVAFIYPSIAEGFGMPILEAFRCGCPCIISDIPCFHEVGGNAAKYFNPNEVDDISSTIESVINNKTTLGKLRQSGFERMKLFSWEETARRTFDVYNSLL